MSFSVQTNPTSLIAQSVLGKSHNRMTTSMERLATGLRINSAADDAAGLQIADRMKANVVGMKAASRNVADGVSMLQTADGALEELNTIASRQKELATQAANGVNNKDDKAALSKEFDSLTKEAQRIVDTTEFGGQKLFGKDGVLTNANGTKLQIGSRADSNNQLDVKLDSIDLKSVTLKNAADAEPKTGADLKTLTDAVTNAADPAAKKTAQDALDADQNLVFNADNSTITAVDDLMKTVDKSRSAIGSKINRLQHTASNLTSMIDKTETAKGHIMDADFAVESSNMTKNQLLQQSGIKVLGRSNQSTSMVMGLLG